MTIDLGTMPTSITPVGSRVTCDPAPTDTDRDWLVLVPPEKFAAFQTFLIDAGWSQGGSDTPDESNETEPDDRFQSYTLGVENVIATCSEQFHRRFLAATSVAKLLNLQDKSHRIALFQAVLYANPYAVTLPAALPPQELAQDEFALF